MFEPNPKDRETYKRISNALENAFRVDDSFTVKASVLLKYLLSITIKEYGPAEAVDRISRAVNECMLDLKKKDLI